MKAPSRWGRRLLRSSRLRRLSCWVIHLYIRFVYATNRWTVGGGGILSGGGLAGVAIVPVVFATSRRRVLPSWDRFHLALPFGRGAFLWGESIEIARELDPAGLERARLLVEDRMNELADEAD